MHCSISQEVKRINKKRQLIKYNMRNIFFKNHAENDAGRPFFQVKSSDQHLSFNVLLIIDFDMQ